MFGKYYDHCDQVTVFPITKLMGGSVITTFCDQLTYRFHCYLRLKRLMHLLYSLHQFILKALHSCLQPDFEIEAVQCNAHDYNSDSKKYHFTLRVTNLSSCPFLVMVINSNAKFKAVRRHNYCSFAFCCDAALWFTLQQWTMSYWRVSCLDSRLNILDFFTVVYVGMRFFLFLPLHCALTIWPLILLLDRSMRVIN